MTDGDSQQLRLGLSARSGTSSSVAGIQAEALVVDFDGVGVNYGRAAETAATARAARSAYAAQANATPRAVIHAIQATGIVTLAGIARALEARGIRAPAGRSQWLPVQVRRLLAA